MPTVKKRTIEAIGILIGTDKKISVANLSKLMTKTSRSQISAFLCDITPKYLTRSHIGVYEISDTNYQELLSTLSDVSATIYKPERMGLALLVENIIPDKMFTTADINERAILKGHVAAASSIRLELVKLIPEFVEKYGQSTYLCTDDNFTRLKRWYSSFLVSAGNVDLRVIKRFLPKDTVFTYQEFGLILNGRGVSFVDESHLKSALNELVSDGRLVKKGSGYSSEKIKLSDAVSLTDLERLVYCR